MKPFLAISMLVIAAALPLSVAGDERDPSKPEKPAVAQPARPGEPGKEPPRLPGPPRFGDGPRPPGEPRREGDKSEKDKDGRPRYGDWHRWTPRGEQFTPDEVREIVKAVEGKNPKLAERIKDRFVEALGKPSAPPTLTDDQVAKIIDVMKDREPRIVERIQASLKDNPDRVKGMLASQWPRFEKIIELKEKDPELYEAETREIHRGGEVWGLSWKLREAVKNKKDAEAAELKSQLRTKLHEQHAARADTRMLEIERLKAKIEKLRNDLDMDQQAVESHVENMINEIVTGTGRWSKFEKREKDDKTQGPVKPEKPESPDKPK